MDIISQVEKYRLSNFDIVRYQLFMKYIFSRPVLDFNDLDVMTLLVIYGKVKIKNFCTDATYYFNKDISPDEFGSKSQGIRNRLTKLIKKGLVKRDGDEVESLITEGIVKVEDKSLLLNYQLLSLKNEKK